MEFNAATEGDDILDTDIESGLDLENELISAERENFLRPFRIFEILEQDFMIDSTLALNLSGLSLNFSKSSADPAIIARGLFTSWAIPADISPREANFD